MLFKRKQPGISSALLLLLLPLLLLGSLAGAGCTCQPPTNGWPGPTVSSDNYVYMGNIKGKVFCYNLSTQEVDWVQAVAQSGSSGFACTNTSTASGIYGTPVLRQDRVYVGAYDGTVLWVSVDGGSVSGSVFDTKASIVGGITIDGDTLYVGSSNGNLYALDLNAADLSDSQKWQFKTGKEIWCTPVIQDKVVYIASADHCLYAIDSESGNEIWRFETDAAIMSTPLVANGMVYVGGCDRKFCAIKAATEEERLSTQGDGYEPGVRAYDDAHIFDGASNWFWTRALPYNGQIWVGCLDGYVYVLDAGDLGYIDKVKTDGMVFAPPVAFGGKVAVGSEDGWIYIIDPETREFEAYTVDPKTDEAVKASDETKNNPVPIFASMVADEASGILYVHAQGNSDAQSPRLYALQVSDGSAEVLWSIRTDNVKSD